MPYIDIKARARLEYDDPRPTNVGELNYLITVLLDEWFDGDLNYAKINEAIGVLECAKLELYRRIAVPYEDKKRSDNGDVYVSIPHM